MLRSTVSSMPRRPRQRSRRHVPEVPQGEHLPNTWPALIWKLAHAGGVTMLAGFIFLLLCLGAVLAVSVIDGGQIFTDLAKLFR